jgi:hypothetical protein
MVAFDRSSFKGTVSPDNRLYFRFWDIKLVIFAGPFMVFTFFYFIVPEIFKSLFLTCFYENTYYFSRFFQKAFQNLCPAYLLWKSISGFLKVACVLLIRFVKAAFISLLAGFS